MTWFEEARQPKEKSWKIVIDQISRLIKTTRSLHLPTKTWKHVSRAYVLDYVCWNVNDARDNYHCVVNWNGILERRISRRCGSNIGPARLLIFGLDVVSRLSEGANCLCWNELESYLDVLMGLARTRRGFKQPPPGNQLNFQLTAVSLANLSFPFPRGAWNPRFD